MPENKLYPPEGLRPSLTALSELRTAVGTGTVLEAAALRSDAAGTLYFDLDGAVGRMERGEVSAPWVNGAEREIAVLSRVGRPVCFTVLSLQADAKGTAVAHLSRRAAQEAAMAWMMENLKPGSVLSGRVVRMEPYGAFVDIGRGIIALLPTNRISVSRISHPAQRFREGQKILAAVLDFDRENCRLTLTHRELLGTWLENASRFAPGDTVRGVVRSLQSYGCFIELSPNLSGLCDPREDLREGDAVTVYLKSIRPERMKIKLQVIQRLPRSTEPEPLHYWITDGVLDHWIYSPRDCKRAVVETVFSDTFQLQSV